MIDDDENVRVGHFSAALVPMTAAEASAVIMHAEDSRGHEVVIPRAISAKEISFALVANRALDPCSKLAAAEWAGEDAHIPGLEAMDDDHAYRAMHLLVEADAQARV